MPFDYVTVSARRTSGVLDKEFAVVPDVKDAAILDFGDFDAHPHGLRARGAARQAVGLSIPSPIFAASA